MNEFAEKVAVITGGANGISQCIAEKFRKQEKMNPLSSAQKIE